MLKVCMLVTNPCTNDPRVLKEAVALSSKGYEVVILGTRRKGNQKKERVNGITIKRIKRKKGSNTLAGKVEFSYKFTRAAIKEKADIYHAHDLSTLLECYLAARENNAKLVYDSHELYIRTSKLTVGNCLYKLIETMLINKADKTITVNDFIAAILEEKYSLKETPEVIMNCPSLETKCENKDDVYEEIEELIKGNKKIILYQGGMMSYRGLSEIVESMKYLDDSYRLLMIGGGTLLEDLKKLAKEEDLEDRVYFTGLVPYEILEQYTRIGHVGIICFENTSLNNYYASPNKLFEYIHGGLPVIVPDYPFLRKFVTENDVGLLLEEIKPEHISAKIHELLKDENRYREMKKNTKEAREKYNWEKEEKKLINLYKELSGDIDG